MTARCLLLGLTLLSLGACQQQREPPPLEPASWRSDPFLDTLQESTFQFFWKTTDRRTGLTPDRYPTRTFCSIAAVGFGLTAYPIGVERGYISRAEARDAVLNTLRYFWNAPQGGDSSGMAGYKGFFYHFLDFERGVRFRDTELSTIDTGLLFAGVLMCQSYFDRDDPGERQIRDLADSLYRRADWQWFSPRAPLIAMAWYPEQGFGTADWTGYVEAMILYVLALGSPTHPITDDAWSKWSSTYIWGNYYGYEFVSFPPLFGHQYSHCWIDFREIKDDYMRRKGIDYFENSRRATYSQKAYGSQNPEGWRDYSDRIWGISACDGPGDTTFVVDGKLRQFAGYAGRGVAFDWAMDDGTITPTAAGGSIAFAPELSLPALKEMKERYGSRIWKEFGFVDAFNRTFVTDKYADGWFDTDHLGIDQGPILIMAENLRTGFVWETMKKNPHIREGLRRAGFSGGWLDEIQKK